MKFKLIFFTLFTIIYAFDFVATIILLLLEPFAYFSEVAFPISLLGLWYCLRGRAKAKSHIQITQKKERGILI